MSFQTVRGMRDFLPEQAVKKQWIEDTLREVFEKYCFLPLESPTVEDFKLLAAKGSAGEAIKEEIYYFKDKSDRELGLRFDLTVPLARIVASNPQLVKPFKRYQIARVYRYDKPGANRYREFTQADPDIIGTDSMLAEFEIIAVSVDAMQKLGFKQGEFKIRISSRKLLEEIALFSGIKKEQMIDCLRSLDKLDKIGEKGVEEELKEKKISTKILQALQEKKFEQIEKKISNKEPLKEIKELFELLKENSLEKFVELDLSLARGLEYYTGTVFEIALEKGPSVGGGGRYDNLIETYGGPKTPAVGISFGVDRLLDVLETKIKPREKTKILVIPIGGTEKEALKITQQIREIGISAEIDLMQRNISKNLDYGNKKGMKFVLIAGENELKKGEVTLKNMETGKQETIKIKEIEKIREIIR